MSAVDDVWEHAQHVRMWLETASQSLGAASNRSPLGFIANWFSRGASGVARIHEALDAIGKAKVAYVDLQFALQRAELDQIHLATMQLAPGQTSVAPIRDAVAGDLVKIDELVVEVEARQRARKA